jgi:hypothetical protein
LFFSRRIEWFLLLWFGLEVAGYFALTPFPAVRRVMGVVVVGTLVLGRLASRTCRSHSQRQTVAAVAGVGLALGLVFYVVDYCDAWSEKAAAERAAAWIRQQPGNSDASVWFVGHWGFQYYAEHAGMKAATAYHSRLRQGDWLVIGYGVHLQEIHLPQKLMRQVHVLPVSDGVPLYGKRAYGGSMPLEHLESSRIVVHIYRIEQDFVPRFP